MPPTFLTAGEIVKGIVTPMPRIPDQMLDGVAFLYQTTEQAAKNERIGGTAFLLGRPAPRASEYLGQAVAVPFLISNRHVALEGGACVPRFNLRAGHPAGQGWVLDMGPQHWVPHPTGDDIAGACIFGLLDRVQVQKRNPIEHLRSVAGARNQRYLQLGEARVPHLT